MFDSNRQPAGDLAIVVIVDDSPVGSVMATTSPSQPGGSQTTNYASTARNIQGVSTQPTSIQTCRGSRTPTFAEDKTNVTKLAKSIATTLPSQAVLVDFDEDSTVVELLPGIVAAMEALLIVQRTKRPAGSLLIRLDCDQQTWDLSWWWSTFDFSFVLSLCFLTQHLFFIYNYLNAWVCAPGEVIPHN